VTHSYHAMRIAKSMIFGVLDDSHVPVVKAYVTERIEANETDFTFCFQTVDKRVHPGFRHWYDDLSMMGKHYLVSSDAHPDVKRHYTICNCLQPKMKEALDIILESALNDGQQAPKDPELLDTKPRSEVWLTLKDYGFPRGVSTHIYKSGRNAN